MEPRNVPGTLAPPCAMGVDRRGNTFGTVSDCPGRSFPDSWVRDADEGGSLVCLLYDDTCANEGRSARTRRCDCFLYCNMGVNKCYCRGPNTRPRENSGERSGVYASGTNKHHQEHVALDNKTHISPTDYKLPLFFDHHRLAHPDYE